MTTRALCPGSFDPVTLGHLDVIERAAAMFDEVVVAVGTNTTKNPLFTPDERLELLRAAVAGLPGVRVEQMSGLMVDFCRGHGCAVVVKGVRSAADADYELPMAQLNRKVGNVETVLVPTAPQWAYLSSTMIREIALLGGDISEFVPPVVAEHVERAAARRRNDR